MKIEIPFLASLLLIGAANLTARMQAQSVEQALAAAAIEYGMKCMRTVKRLLPRCHAIDLLRLTQPNKRRLVDV